MAGAIALQTLFAGVQGDFTASTRQDPARAQMLADVQVAHGSQSTAIAEAFRTTPGVTSEIGTTEAEATTVGAVAKARESRDPDVMYGVPSVPVTVAGCAELGQLARISGCAPGSVYLVGTLDTGATLRAGERIDLNTPDDNGVVTGGPRLWTIPATARTGATVTDPTGGTHTGVLATPQALDVGTLTDPHARVLLRLDPRDPDAADQARDTGVRFDPSDPTINADHHHAVQPVRRYPARPDGGATAVLLMIGASLLVSMLEQLRERKKLLAVLVAFGTRRATLGRSVLWQTAVPVALGLVLAVAGGLALGGMLLGMTDTPVGFDWAGIAAMAGIGAGVVLAVTALSLPPLWRMMRPDGLRSE